MPSFSEGTLLLKDKDSSWFRLEWPQQRPDASGAAASDRWRALPAGEYTLVSYRLVRRDGKGVEWFISASKPDLRRIVVRPGVNQEVKVEDGIRMKCTTSLKGEDVQVGAAITGDNGAGLSIYQNGKRIAMAYRIEDAQGKRLAGGNMKYG